MVGKSEDEFNETFDRCLADTALKTIGAGAVGVLAAVLFKRQSPLLICIGFGLGMGVANCRNEMRRPFIHDKAHSAKVTEHIHATNQPPKIDSPEKDGQ